MGTAANSTLFSSNGAVTDTCISQITGNVGTNNGSSTGLGNVYYSVQDSDATSAQCMADLHAAYLFLNTATATHFPSPALGHVQTIDASAFLVISSV